VAEERELNPVAMQAMLDVVDGMRPMAIAVRQYRDALVEEGISAEAADLMAVDFHRVMLASSFGAAGKAAWR
jgi:hypothetical protein